MKVAVIGSRSFDDYDLLERTLSELSISLLVSGGAKGADSLAERYADEHQISKQVFLPDYARYGRGAPLQRNYQIVDAAERVVAFWDQKSRGTRHTIEYAERVGKPVTIILID